MLVACAAVNSPTGGEKDTEAPEVVSMEPKNESTQFDAAQFQIRFNEFIAQEDFKKKLIISPPLGDDLKVVYKGKKLKFILPDSLATNTTYSFQFGNSIKDYTEGNTLNNFQYVFSTGEELDSLKLNGHVLNAASGLAVENAWVLLYDATENPDSLLYNRVAKYVTQTDDQGNFNFSYLSAKKYHLFGLVDMNGDLNYQPNNELVGFYSGLVYPDTLLSPAIGMFPSEKSLKFLGVRYSQYGRLDIKFQGNQKPFEVVIESPEIHYETWNSSMDSSSIWFNPEGIDSVLTYVYSDKGIDTSITKVLPFKKRSFQLDKFKESYHDQEKVIISSVMPFELVDSSKMLLINAKMDTIPFELQIMEGKGYELKFKKIEEEKYTLQFAPNCFTSYLDDGNDSLKYDFFIHSKSVFSSVNLLVDSLYTSPNLLVQLTNNKGVIVQSAKLEEGSSSVNFNYLSPGEYHVLLIYDDNKNGKWDTGRLIGQKHPELVLRHDSPLKLKANWVVEINFQASKLNLSESNKKGNFFR